MRLWSVQEGGKEGRKEEKRVKVVMPAMTGGQLRHLKKTKALSTCAE